MNKTTYKISKMDCLAEENLVRMKLESCKNIEALVFDITERKLNVFHKGKHDPITLAIDELHLNSKLIVTEVTNEHEEFISSTVQERKLLWQVLSINIFFFLAEIVAGIVSNSIGLVADSLDMFADAIVYALALFVVGKMLAKKRKIATLSGYLQLLLAVFGFVEVIKKFINNSKTPDFKVMMIVSLFALVGNVVTLYLLQKSKSKEPHMKASMIFTSTDVIVNTGVLIAGAIVYFTGSNLPDLIIGTIIFAFVGFSSYRILKL
jgi:Co/Zn/Cd efflux system component